MSACHRQPLIEFAARIELVARMELTARMELAARGISARPATTAAR